MFKHVDMCAHMCRIGMKGQSGGVRCNQFINISEALFFP